MNKKKIQKDTEVPYYTKLILSTIMLRNIKCRFVSIKFSGKLDVKTSLPLNFMANNKISKC